MVMLKTAMARGEEGAGPVAASVLGAGPVAVSVLGAGLDLWLARHHYLH